jgi:ribonuclease R
VPASGSDVPPLEELSDFDADREAFARGEKSCAETPVLRDFAVESLQRPSRGFVLGIVEAVVGDHAECEGVVAQDDSTDTKIVGGPLKVFGVADLVGIDEYEIERALFLDAGEIVHGWSDEDLRLLVHSRAAESLARHLGVLRLVLEGIELALRAHGPEEANAGVARQRADLDRFTRPGHAGEDLQMKAIHAPDVNGGQSLGFGSLTHFGQNSVFRLKLANHILSDLFLRTCAVILVHAPFDTANGPNFANCRSRVFKGWAKVLIKTTMGRKNDKRGKGQNSGSSGQGSRAKRWDRDREQGRGGGREREGAERPDEGGSGAGGIQIRDRSGKVHVIGGRGGRGGAGKAQQAGRGAEPEAPTSRPRDFFGGKEQVYRPRPESEVVARPARGKKPQQPRARGAGGLIRLKASVDKNRKGFAFLAFENRQYEDSFVPPREAQALFHGDRVEVVIASNGEVHEINVLEHRFRELTGRFAPHPMGPSHGGWIVYERKRSREEVYVPELKDKVEDGDWVRASLEFHEKGQHLVTAQILQVYGKDLPPSADVGMIANEYNLVEEHPEASEQEAREKKLEIPGKDLQGREDLRDVPFITIDGETARDFDDAIYVERDKNGFVLWVAIADVSHYVQEGSALDQDAVSRGTSVYFPERAFHMLPRALSENLCSLRPDEPRLTLVARMEYDKEGKRTRTEVMEAVIQSKRRATYNQIQAEWETNRSNGNWEYSPHFALYQLIRKQRSDRGSIDFDLPEAETLVEKTGEVISIKNRARQDSHRLIEEFMISANEAVTEWAMERGWPFVYRVHDVPAMLALEKFQTLAANVGVDFSIGDASPKVMAELVKRLEGHPAQELLNTALLRSMKQAVYSSVHGVHFGLASEGYTHFTSPIRRYPDLVVHRILRQALRTEKGQHPHLSAPERQKMEDKLTDITEHCSYRERLAAEAERQSIRLKQVRLMQKHLGDEFEGKINGMTENGMFTQLDDPFVEGMIHKDTLDDDYYQFDDEHMIFFGQRKRRTFKMGDRVKVRVARADIDLRMIDFELLEGGTQGAVGEHHTRKRAEKHAEKQRGQRPGPGGGGGRGGKPFEKKRGGGGGGKPFEKKRGPSSGPWQPRAAESGGLGRADQRREFGGAPNERYVDEPRPRKGKRPGKDKDKGKRRRRK